METKNRLFKVTVGVISWLLVAGGVVTAEMQMTLQDAINIALQNNLNIAVAYSQKDQAAAQLDYARALQGPTLSWQNQSQVNENSTYRPNPYTAPLNTQNQNYSNTFSLSYTIADAGLTSGKVGAADYNLKLQAAKVDSSRENIRFNTAYYFYSVLAASQLVKVDQEAVQRSQEHLKNVQAQFAVGTVAKSDVLRTEVELANNQQTLIRDQNRYKLAVANLINVLNLPLNTEIKLDDSELRYTRVGISLDAATDYGMKNRPEITQAAMQVGVAEQTLQQARAGQGITLQFQAQEVMSDGTFPGFSSGDSNASAAVVASFDIFDNGQTSSQVAAAEKGLAAARQQLDLQKLQTALDVKQAYLSMRDAEERIAATKVAVAQAEEDYKIAVVRYEAGVGTNLDVLDAHKSLTQAQTDYLSALYDYDTQLAALVKAMGIPVDAKDWLGLLAAEPSAVSDPILREIDGGAGPGK
ncbi:MAG: TolC family protein [Negativicutes bacterium]|nr:TolC family protein [Negativicutes bacterium]